MQHTYIKKVAVNSGGKHCLALSADGHGITLYSTQTLLNYIISHFFFFLFKMIVYSWGEGEDGKLGHNNRVNYDRPKLIEALSGLGVVDIACGSAHSACIISSGHILTWGKGR